MKAGEWLYHEWRHRVAYLVQGAAQAKRWDELPTAEKEGWASLQDASGLAVVGLESDMATLVERVEELEAKLEAQKNSKVKDRWV